VAVEKQANTRIPVPPAAAQGRQNFPPSLWFHFFPSPGANESFCKCVQAAIPAATLQPVVEALAMGLGLGFRIIPQAWRRKHITLQVQIMVRISQCPCK
jgi:hypothetical protein